jgi:hypothetical protein
MGGGVNYSSRAHCFTGKRVTMRTAASANGRQSAVSAASWAGEQW